MKNIYLRILVGLVFLGTVFILDTSFLNDISMAIFCIFIFFIPSVIFNGKRFLVWTISFPLLILSLWITIIFPINSKSDVGCFGIFCGMDDRPMYILIAYFSLLMIISFLQLRQFVQKKIAEKHLKTQIK
ncbi:MAG: hypothetical protein ACR2IQ_03150 [Minisyncoccia bacterium]